MVFVQVILEPATEDEAYILTKNDHKESSDRQQSEIVSHCS